MDKPKKKYPREGLPNYPGKRGPKGPSKWTEDKLVELGEELIAWLKASPENIFLQEFLVMEKGVYKDILSDLVKRSDKFASLVKEAKTIQEIKLGRKTMERGTNPAGAIFLLKNHHAYADKQEVKSENINRNYSSGSLESKTAEELQRMLEDMSQ